MRAPRAPLKPAATWQQAQPPQSGGTRRPSLRHGSALSADGYERVTAVDYSATAIEARAPATRCAVL